MAVKTVKLDSVIPRTLLAVTALGVLLFAWVYIRSDIAASVAYSGLDSRSPESRPVADWMLETAPNDPYVHWAAARFFERSFEPNDYPRALENYEFAVALSPHHFNFWLFLARAHDRAGDVDRAEEAYRRSVELAPSYAPVRWAYGNSLIRHGKTADGFSFVSAAVESDP